MNFHGKLLAAAFVAAASMGFATAGWATGPVSAAGVPGTVTVTDSDGGNGQRWGRAGGRDFVFTVNTPSAFSDLRWGVVGGTNPSLAFDGAVTTSTGEVMSYSSGQSTATTVRWLGNANLNIVTLGTFSVPTRFTLTFTNPGGPATVTLDPGTAFPGVSLLASGQVHANLLFEMQYLTAMGGDNQWHPVLDLYDALATPAGQPPSTNTGPVMTGVTTGFYYTNLVAGLTLEQHDANVTNQLNAIKGDTSFIKTDMVGRLTQIGNDVSDVRNAVSFNLTQTVSDIQQKVTQLANAQGNGGSSNTATRADIQDLQTILLVTWGLMPCPSTFPSQCLSAKKIQDLATQASVDEVKASASGILIGLNQLATSSSVATLSSKVDALQSALSAAQAKIGTLQDMIDGGTSFAVTTMLLPAVQKQVRWLVGTSRGGVAFNPSSVKVSAVFGGTSPATVRDVAAQVHVTTIAAGLHDISVDVVKGVSDGDAYVIEVGLVENGATLKGSAVVSSATK